MAPPGARERESACGQPRDAFFEAGGVVVGYGRLPERSLSLGKTAADIARLREAFTDLPEQPDAQTVFVKLRELRNSW